MRRMRKIIGKLENGSMTIRHKGRSVVISPILADINVEIVCESCKTINKFQKNMKLIAFCSEAWYIFSI